MKQKRRILEKNENYFENNKSELLDMPEFIKYMAKEWNNRIVDDFKFIEDTKLGKFQSAVYHVPYEKLIIDTESYRSKMYQFLGLIPNLSKPLDNLTKPEFQTHNPNSHYRMGKAGRWKEYFTKDINDLFLNEASEALEMLNLEKEIL